MKLDWRIIILLILYFYPLFEYLFRIDSGNIILINFILTPILIYSYILSQLYKKDIEENTNKNSESLKWFLYKFSIFIILALWIIYFFFDPPFNRSEWGGLWGFMNLIIVNILKQLIIMILLIIVGLYLVSFLQKKPKKYIYKIFCIQL